MFLELSGLLISAVIIAAIMSWLRLPLILGYIITGILVGPFALNLISSHDLLESMSHVGVALLLFIIGLSLSPRIVKEIGKMSFIVGFLQVFTTSLLGVAAGLAIGFDLKIAIFVGLALSFSSTIIIMKLLTDRHELHRFYGRTSLGLLIVQDIIASFMLIFVTNISISDTQIENFLMSFGKLGLLLLAFVLLSKFVVPRVSQWLVTSQELLFLFSVTWALGAAIFAWEVGLSIEIGGLLAGVTFASLPYAKQMSTKMMPLHDILLAIFFVLLGAQMNFSYLSETILPALLFSIIILIGNPLIVMYIMRILGYKKKTNFRTGLAAAQTGEFALLIIILGYQSGIISEYIVTLVTLVALITIVTSSYMIFYSNYLYRILASFLNLFEPKKTKPESVLKGMHTIVLGYKESLFDSDGRWRLAQDDNFLIIDKNPSVIEMLHGKGVPVEYGDIRDLEFLNELYLENTKLVISSIKDKEVNKLFIEHAKRNGYKGIIVASCKTMQDALELYESGCDYVEVLEDASVKEVTKLLKYSNNTIVKEGKKHMKELQSSYA